MMKDMIPGFELIQPASVEGALNLLEEYGEDGWALAGGMDSLGWFKNRGKRPEAVIDLEGLDALKGIDETDDGIEIGALTTLTEVERNPLIRERFWLLSEAASKVASPQIRNAGTLGGNLCQDTRCWYYRYGVSCYRAGGNTCYAGATDALNREHASFGANRGVAGSPSDTATALVALDAEMVVRNSSGERVGKADNFFMEPAVDIMRMTVLQPGDLLTKIRIPSTWAGAQFYFEKVRDREVWDFPLVNVASAMRVSGSTIDDARVAGNGTAPYPMRLGAVEDAVRGASQSEATAELAGEVAVRGARPLRQNAYKGPLMRNLVKRSIRGEA